MIEPELEEFTTNFLNKKNQVIFKRLAGDLETAVSLMIKLTNNENNSFLLESVTGGEIRGRYSIIGMEPDLIWKCEGNKSKIKRNAQRKKSNFEVCNNPPLIELRKIISESKIDFPENIPKMSAGLFGYIGYDIIKLVENLPKSNKDELRLPDSIFVRPSILIIIDGVKDEIIIVSPIWYSEINLNKKSSINVYEETCKKIENIERKIAKKIKKVKINSNVEKEIDIKCNTSKAEYLKIVEKAKNYIKKGEIFQVVPSQRWKVPFEIHPFYLYRALRRTNPSPYMFFFNFGNFQIIGASPEILVKVKDRKVTIRPIAGTRPRGRNTEEDNFFEKDLLNDKKELAEHLMLLDLGRNDVGKVSKIGSVLPTEKFVIEKYSHVMHIVSNVEGELSSEHDNLSALLSGLPAGTVSGAPKIRAMQIIEELENDKRGVYGGGVGYFSANGDMDICIALRTGIIKNKELHIQAGGGVVFDSDPEKEYQETINKSLALISAVKEAYNF